MQKRKILIANWKTYIKNFSEIDEKIDEIKDQVFLKDLDIVICPSYIHLQSVANKLKDFEVSIGSQNLCSSESDANTGEVLASMLTDVGCQYCILGHSEVRERNNESSNIVASKVQIALKNSIIPIVCVGETLELREKSDYIKFLINQTIESLPQVSNIEEKDIIIAYEPIWSIGTGKIPNNNEIEEVVRALKNIPGSQNFRFVYGGSVNEKNIFDIHNIKSLDGVLVGGASTDIAKLKIISQTLQDNYT